MIREKTILKNPRTLQQWVENESTNGKVWLRLGVVYVSINDLSIESQFYLQRLLQYVNELVAMSFVTSMSLGFGVMPCMSSSRNALTQNEHSG